MNTTRYFIRYHLTGMALRFIVAHCNAYALVADEDATLFDSMTEANLKAFANGLKANEFTVELTTDHRPSTLITDLPH